MGIADFSSMAALEVSNTSNEPKSNSRPRKRPRKALEEAKVDKSQPSTSNTRLFVPFRALGLVTNHVPFVIQTRSFKGATDGPRVHILTCLGRSWALWEGGKMTLLFVGEWSQAAMFRS
jgi:U3 small nucleolar RNA-associated protein 21